MMSYLLPKDPREATNKKGLLARREGGMFISNTRPGHAQGGQSENSLLNPTSAGSFWLPSFKGLIPEPS